MVKRRRTIKKVVRKGKTGKKKRRKATGVRDMRGPAHMSAGLREMCNHIKEHGPPVKKMIEIGSYSGESTVIFAQEFPDAEIICIDPWELVTDPFDRILADTGTQAHQKFLERTKPYPNISFIKKMSAEAACLIEDDSVDLVYIDGNHGYKYVVEDITNYMPKLHMNCFLAGHDWFLDPKAKWFCVTRAVRDVLGEPDKTFRDHSWLWFKSEESLKGTNL